MGRAKLLAPHEFELPRLTLLNRANGVLVVSHMGRVSCLSKADSWVYFAGKCVKGGGFPIFTDLRYNSHLARTAIRSKGWSSYAVMCIRRSQASALASASVTVTYFIVLAIAA